jgi:hypothetical protein
MPGRLTLGERGSAAMSVDFKDISLIGTDEERTCIGIEGTGVYHVYLKLSAHPSDEWTQLFDQERQFARHSMWRRAWVEDIYIIVEAPLAEMARYHVRDVTEDVRNVNDKYRILLAKQRQQQAQVKDAASVEREKVKQELAKLKFD